MSDDVMPEGRNQYVRRVLSQVCDTIDATFESEEPRISIHRVEATDDPDPVFVVVGRISGLRVLMTPVGLQTVLGRGLVTDPGAEFVGAADGFKAFLVTERPPMPPEGMKN